jgi:hypothetical protein
MKQILHIFAKDARHFLPEILVSFAITAVFAWIYPSQWLQSQAAAGGSFLASQEMALLASLITLLVPVSWWLLISRVIHAENLVGDCQFWITRPYEWKNLLAAKALFLICFLYLPLFVAQCFLLVQAGFQPLGHLPGLLFNFFLISAVVVVPLFALATVTSTFARMTLTLLGILFCFIASSVISSAIDHTRISNPLPDRLTLPFLLCGLATIVVFQYGRRRTWLARILLVAFVVAIWAGTSLIPSDTVIQHAYPRATSTPSPSLQLAAQDSLDQPTAFLAPRSKQVGIRLPLQISGIADGYAWSAENVKVSIDGPDGFAWSSPWQAMYARSLPGQQDFTVQFTMNRAIFDQLRSAPIALHLTFAWTQLRSGTVQHIDIPTRDFAVPGFGACSPNVNWTATHPEIGYIMCRFALRHPRLTYVDTRWSEDPCSGPATPATGIEGSGWMGSLDPDPAQFTIPAVWVTSLPLSNNWNDNDGRPTKPRHLCPGTPLTFTEYTVGRRAQSDFTIPNFRLPAYKALTGTVGTSIGFDATAH